MTNRTHVIQVMDPETFKPVRTIPVLREDGKPLMQINELEWIKGELWANIWHSEDPNILGKPNYIARIDPTSGKLLGWIDLGGISPDDQPTPRTFTTPATRRRKIRSTASPTTQPATASSSPAKLEKALRDKGQAEISTMDTGQR